MNDKTAKKLLSELVKEIDYDIWKSYFVKECIEEPEFIEERINDLTKIIKKYD